MLTLADIRRYGIVRFDAQNRKGDVMQLWTLEGKNWGDEWKKKEVDSGAYETSFLEGAAGLEHIIDRGLSNVKNDTAFLVLSSKEEEEMRRIVAMFFKTGIGQMPELVSALNRLFEYPNAAGSHRFVVIAEDNPRAIGLVRTPAPLPIRYRVAFGLNISKESYAWHEDKEPAKRILEPA